MKGKKGDLLAQKGLKWVSNRIHALELSTGQGDRKFLPGFKEHLGEFKPKSKQSLKAIDLSIHQMGGVGKSRD